MGKGALTLAVTLLAADAWLVRASPGKSKYAIDFISVVENKVQQSIRTLMMRIKSEKARKSRGQIDGSDLWKTLVQIRNNDVVEDLTPNLGACSSSAWML